MCLEEGQICWLWLQIGEYVMKKGQADKIITLSFVGGVGQLSNSYIKDLVALKALIDTIEEL